MKHHAKLSEESKNLLHKRLNESITLVIVPKTLAEVANNILMEQSRGQIACCGCFITAI